jgi:hypothetical protein
LAVEVIETETGNKASHLRLLDSLKSKGMRTQRGDMMKAGSIIARIAVCSALGLLPATALRAQDKALHKMEIFNGSVRTVHYFLDRDAPAERAALSELERAENETALAGELAALRRQYVNDERFLEARRTNVQQLLYGYSTQYGTGLYAGWNYDWSPFGRSSFACYPFGGLGYGGYPYGGSGGYPYGGYYGYPPFYFGALAGTSAKSLSFGVGDEGRIKAEMARTLAGQAAPAHGVEAYNYLQSVLSAPSLPKISGGPSRADTKSQKK